MKNLHHTTKKSTPLPVPQAPTDPQELQELLVTELQAQLVLQEMLVNLASVVPLVLLGLMASQDQQAIQAKMAKTAPQAILVPMVKMENKVLQEMTENLVLKGLQATLDNQVERVLQANLVLMALLANPDLMANLAMMETQALQDVKVLKVLKVLKARVANPVLMAFQAAKELQVFQELLVKTENLENLVIMAPMELLELQAQLVYQETLEITVLQDQMVIQENQVHQETFQLATTLLTLPLIQLILSHSVAQMLVFLATQSAVVLFARVVIYLNSTQHLMQVTSMANGLQHARTIPIPPPPLVMIQTGALTNLTTNLACSKKFT